MNSKKLKAGMLTMVLLLTSTVMWAQAPKASPAATAKGTINGANISISYSSPAVKGRKIYGELVPFDKVWRAGANEATVFTTDKKVMIGKTPLEAGSYSIYVIPGEKTWKVIFNSQTGQWGSTHGGESTRVPEKDVVSILVKPSKTAALEERLKYEVTPKGFILAWENQSVLVPVK
ncbi:DUF2911 domain-containing protein [Pedobacter sp. AW31-3R]|uniref:DUF2911 domain-containing protein n=1 Tax=Pedobacter sp. AW31-3R TaxID=3445781 RepID=UPI003F9FDFB2